MVHVPGQVWQRQDAAQVVVNACLEEGLQRSSLGLCLVGQPAEDSQMVVASGWGGVAKRPEGLPILENVKTLCYWKRL